MATPPTAIAQRSTTKLFFDHKDMDYYLSWVVGRQIYDGSDRHECLATAARIQNGDAASWQRAWEGLAQRIEAQAFAPDAIVYHPKMLASYHIAEKLAIPCLFAIPMPLYTPTRA